MLQKINKGRILSAALLAACILFAFSLFFFTRKAKAFQIKRVVRGAYTLPSASETTTQSTGVTIDTSKSFVLGYRRMSIDSRRKADAIIAIDDPTNLLISEEKVLLPALISPLNTR